MSQLGYMNGMINAGYEEIDKSECPAIWIRKRKVLYLKKDNMYAMVDQHGHFVHWNHPEDTEKVKKRYEYVKPKNVIYEKSEWAKQMEENLYD